MNIKIRPFLLTAGAFLLATINASAQFVELVTEAPVTLSAVLTTTNSTTNQAGTEQRATAVVTKLTHAQILEELRTSGIIPAESTTGWKLVAVALAPADLVYVDGKFTLYAVNGDQRILIPDSKFSAVSYNAVAKYKERHLGQYVIDSAGTVTNHVSYSYFPSLTVNNALFSIVDCDTDGFASIAYKAKTVDGLYEAFFYANSSLRATCRGSFTSDSGQGLITLSVALGTAKLVEQSLYPEVAAFTGADL